jgi:hypothetical protein
MILPSKHLASDRSLLQIGGQLLQLLEQDLTVSSLWERTQAADFEGRKIGYFTFVLALDLLYMLGAVTLDAGLLTRTQPKS